PTAAQALARQFRSIDRIAAASAEEIAASEGIGPVIAGAVAKWFADSRHYEILAKLRSGGVELTDQTGDEGPRPLEGITVVITGSLVDYSRDSAIEAVQARGGK